MNSWPKLAQLLSPGLSSALTALAAVSLSTRAPVTAGTWATGASEGGGSAAVSVFFLHPTHTTAQTRASPSRCRKRDFVFILFILRLRF